MTFDLEIMLRNDVHVFTDSIVHDRDLSDWTAVDVQVVLEAILSKIARLVTPGADVHPNIQLRGVSWIVHPNPEGVVIAIEIHSASAVAGPFAIAQGDLERLIAQAMQSAASSATVH